MYGSLLNGSTPNNTASYNIIMDPVQYEEDDGMSGARAVTSTARAGTSTASVAGTGAAGTGISTSTAGAAGTGISTASTAGASTASASAAGATNDMFLLNSQKNPSSDAPVGSCSTANSAPNNCRPSPVPPCPPCERCPEAAFDCKRVPRYNSATNSQYLPQPVLADFSQFGM